MYFFHGGFIVNLHFLVVSHDSIRGCVRPSVGWSVGRLVRRSVGNAFVKIAESIAKSIEINWNLVEQLNRNI